MITRAPRIPAVKRNKLVKCFAMDLDATAASQIAKVSRPCANRWYRHFRELIYRDTRLAPRFFGEVEMDQAEFGGRGRKRMQALLKRYAKVMPHSEYMKKAKDIRREHKVIVFGILQRQGKVYAHIISRADTRTLQPIVRLVVEQGSTIFTDKWRGFTELGIDGYEHRSVNHSEEYVDKQGNHINGIEAFWSFAKRRTTKFNGIARTTLPLHIKECQFRYNEKDIAGALKNLLRAYDTDKAAHARRRILPPKRHPSRRKSPPDTAAVPSANPTKKNPAKNDGKKKGGPIR